MKESCRPGRNCLSPPLSAWCVLLFFLLAGTWLHAKGAFTWDEAFALIEAKFPDVPTIDVPTFQKWRKEDPHLLLIDVRKTKEFQISRIPGAVNETRLSKIRDLIQDPDNKAILYCSVGYRSARLVEKLKAKGFRQVYNLKGSIFEWANQGNRLVNNSGETVYVHPYHARWGQLLDVDRHPPD